MTKRNKLKFAVMEESTKNAFDQLTAHYMQTAGRDIHVTQDYVIRQMIANTIEKIELQRAQAVEVENVPK